MGAALNMASASNALSCQTERLSFKKNTSTVSVEGDKRLFNHRRHSGQSEKHPSVKKDLGQQFIPLARFVSPAKAIANYKINGEQFFTPTPMIPTRDVLVVFGERFRRSPYNGI
jgi:tungstate transport system substrate-binding protein